MRSKKIVCQTPLLAIGLLLTWVMRVSAQPCEVEGEFRQAPSRDRLNINFHCDSLGEKPDAIYVEATLQHEIIHAFKAQGVIDDDVPMAAAMGYYTEWTKRGTLRDNTKVALFKQGLTASVGEVNALIDKYKRRTQREPLESYEDGAKLAGIIFKLFGKDDGKAKKYILALGMGLDQQFALEVVARDNIARVIFRLRFGDYLLFDNDKLAHDLNALDPLARTNVERYIKSVNDRTKIGLVPKRDVVVGALPK
jgi:hypothetical protein